MDFDRLNRWLSLVANLGLLAGLILLAVQINQNSQLARMQLISEGQIAANQVWAVTMGESPSTVIAKSIESPKQMTYADFMVMDAWLSTSLNVLYRNYELAREGIFEETHWQEGEGTYANWLLANPFGRAWWDELARYIFEPEFVDYVDQQLERESEKDSMAYWLRLRARLME